MPESFCPRLIEVALPIREISAESVRDKSLRHGHISTLHLWWARRPLAASRAVVFASLVPDPDDHMCPEDFRQVVERLLKTKIPPSLQSYRRGREVMVNEDPYRPYEELPDSLRNRLLMFIAKWSPEARAFEKAKTSKPPKPGELLDDRCLVKWETSDPENPQGQEVLRIARQLIKVANNGKTPVVLDPFAGGGSIPLEAGRLGCQPIANDYNPVAYLILRATCEFPQKYGKPGERDSPVVPAKEESKQDSQINFLKSATKTRRSKNKKLRSKSRPISNVLVHDVERWANWILERARGKIGQLYPTGKDGKPVVGYIWARTVPCSNPSCRGEMPLLRSLLVCNKPGKQIALTLDVNKGKKIVKFGIAGNREIKHTAGTMQQRGNVLCPFCDQVTPVNDLRRAGVSGDMGERIVAVIVEGKVGKEYRPVEDIDLFAFQEASRRKVEPPKEFILQEVTTSDEHIGHRGQFTTYLYGMKTWGSLFNHRQLVAMETFVECMHEAFGAMKLEKWEDEYRKAVGVYLGLWVSRVAQRSSNVGLWHTSRETLEHPFGRQAIPMTWDYPEANPFSESTGGAEGGIDWMKRVIIHESNSVLAGQVHRGDGATLPVDAKVANVVVTDPPYFDAIAYGDLSDYFYVWLKRSLGDLVPEVLITPLTPKSDEATALKHRHGGDEEKADRHFVSKLAAILSESKRTMVPGGLVSIMFAHQSTKAWTALINAIFAANLTVDSTWPIDTELTTALKANISSLSSSIVVSCRSRIVGSAASFKDVRKEIEQVVQESVKRFWGYGFRGADLIVACYGPAVGVFGRYERVEKADGTLVQIPELLELARKAARDAIAGEFRGDNLSTLYYVWANLYGAAEQAWDDARLVVQIGGESENAMEVAKGHGIFVVDGSRCRLAMLSDRGDRRGLGVDLNPPLVDALHHSMVLWKQERRSDLVSYLNERGLLEDGPFWKLAQALFEVLPRDTEDWKITGILLGERETLRREGKTPDGMLFRR